MKAVARMGDWGGFVAVAVGVALAIFHAWAGDVLGTVFFGGLAALVVAGNAANLGSLLVTRAYGALFVAVGTATVVRAVLLDSGAWQAAGVIIGGALALAGCSPTLWKGAEVRDGGASGDRELG